MATSIEEWIEELSAKVLDKSNQFEDLFEKEFASGIGMHFMNQMIPAQITFVKGVHDVFGAEYDYSGYAEVFMKKDDQVNENEKLYFVFKEEGGSLFATHLFKDPNEIKTLLQKAS